MLNLQTQSRLASPESGPECAAATGSTYSKGSCQRFVLNCSSATAPGLDLLDFISEEPSFASTFESAEVEQLHSDKEPCVIGRTRR